MFSFDMERRRYEPFYVPFSKIPFIYNGSVGSLIKGASCFAFFILEKKDNKNMMEHTIDYLFTDEEYEKELMFNTRLLLEERLEITRGFLEREFSFIFDIDFASVEKLFVFTAFLDQLAVECFEYIEYKQPKIENYISAFKHIELLAKNRDNLSPEKITILKEELLEVLALHKPEAYFGIIFNVD